jgi:hypothetical protein
LLAIDPDDNVKESTRFPKVIVTIFCQKLGKISTEPFSNVLVFIV